MSYHVGCIILLIVRLFVDGRVGFGLISIGLGVLKSRKVMAAETTI